MLKLIDGKVVNVLEKPKEAEIQPTTIVEKKVVEVEADKPKAKDIKVTKSVRK